MHGPFSDKVQETVKQPFDKALKPLPLADLSNRHPGLTKAIGDAYTEAASVCLSRHHAAPINVAAISNGKTIDCIVEWSEPAAGTLRAWANEIDTTEQGAYGMSLAAVEAIEGLVAMRRAETLTGADYYIAPVGGNPDDLEDCLRLEVSGVGAGGKAAVESRLRSKLDQAAKGASNLPAMALVVGFKERLIVMTKLDNKR